MSEIVGHSSYLAPIYDPVRFKNLIARVAQEIKAFRKENRFDAIAFRGSSGAAAAFPLSLRLGIPIIYVRKDNESGHGQKVEGPNKAVKTFIIVDDLIASGRTVKAILDALPDATCLGIFLYKDRPDEPLFPFEGRNIPVEFIGNERE